MDYPNIVVKSHKGIRYVTYNLYTREEIEIIERNISSLDNKNIKRYLVRLIKQFETKLMDQINSGAVNEELRNSDSYNARLAYLRTIINYLNQRLEPYNDDIDEIRTGLTGLNHIITVAEDGNKYRINENIKLIDLIRLIYCLNIEKKLKCVLLTNDLIKLITERFIWKEEIKSKTIKSYLNQMQSDARHERSKLSMDIKTIDESIFIDLINGLI